MPEALPMGYNWTQHAPRTEFSLGITSGLNIFETMNSPKSASHLKDIKTVQNMDLEEMMKSVSQASSMLKLLANEHRLLILCLLSENELTVSELSEFIPLSQSPLSQHLAKLRAEGLVKTRKVSQHVYYSLKSEEAKAVIQTLHSLYCDPK